MSTFWQAREKYRPDPIKVLFITEAPPDPQHERYFYFEHVRRGDSLFLELIKVLFPEEVEAFETVKQLRAEKPYFLERLQDEGYFLMSPVDRPLPGFTAAARTKVYQEHLPDLIRTLLQIARPTTPIVIISAVVFRAIAPTLRASGFRVIHDDLIEFPNSGQQANFRRKLKALLQQKDLLPAPL
ncbi:hypothetical protein SAMN05421823_101411 [Catalinimonas alkaloidigena]|uniref:Uncharacterized protein n=1 Tax=Catalinimonas alkaloidigena TaxID=1075417 RepID=A0A1G8XP38_9BACT|nr:hypothetical protein [Catalinimonas alkaloidigena]SDJ91540.1 hypothetical protein SAMN05421823_101411 [Catalinimonas alkaloidigena]